MMDFLLSLNPEHAADIVGQLFGEAFRSDFTRMTAAFTMAAWLHRKWMKKDISEHVKNLTDGLTKVADGFQKHTTQLSDHSTKLDNHEKRIGVLESDVGILKQQPKGE